MFPQNEENIITMVTINPVMDEIPPTSMLLYTIGMTITSGKVTDLTRGNTACRHDWLKFPASGPFIICAKVVVVDIIEAVIVAISTA